MNKLTPSMLKTCQLPAMAPMDEISGVFLDSVASTKGIEGKLCLQAKTPFFRKTLFKKFPGSSPLS